MENTLQSGKGLIGHGQTFTDLRSGEQSPTSGFAKSMIQLGWVCQSVGADPTIAARFVFRYRDLTDLAVEKGKVASAAMLGNLLGDLEQGFLGDKDFLRACDAFARSIPREQRDGPVGFIKDTCDLFCELFVDELAEISKGNSSPKEFTRLVGVLAEAGYSLSR